MLKFFLDRILPKDRPVKIDLPPIEHRRDLIAAYAAIVQAVGAGTCSSEGSAVAALLASIAKFIDDAESKLDSAAWKNSLITSRQKHDPPRAEKPADRA